jgi:adenosine deaminase CECR1
VDLIGWEKTKPEEGRPTDFQTGLTNAKRHYPRVHLTLHAGESNESTPHVRDSILLGAERIGHGLNLSKDPFKTETMELVTRRSVLIEICLHSNRLLYNVPIVNHPFRCYLKDGMMLSLNTDNRGVFEKSLTEEFVDAVQAFGLSWSQVKTLCENSIDYGFMSRADRITIKTRWRNRWAEFERNPPDR